MYTSIEFGLGPIKLIKGSKFINEPRIFEKLIPKHGMEERSAEKVEMMCNPTCEPLT